MARTPGGAVRRRHLPADHLWTTPSCLATRSVRPDHVPHARLVKRLLFVLDAVVVPPYELLAEVEWTPDGEQQAPVPDLSVFWPTSPKRVVCTPVLVIEILSRNRNYDIEYKRELYARWGLPTYWIVDPPNRTLRVHELSGGELVETARMVGGGIRRRPARLLRSRGGRSRRGRRTVGRSGRSR